MSVDCDAWLNSHGAAEENRSSIASPSVKRSRPKKNRHLFRFQVLYTWKQVNDNKNNYNYNNNNNNEDKNIIMVSAHSTCVSGASQYRLLSSRDKKTI